MMSIAMRVLHYTLPSQNFRIVSWKFQAIPYQNKKFSPLENNSLNFEKTMYNEISGYFYTRDYTYLLAIRMYEIMKKAILAGERALTNLKTAQEKLSLMSNGKFTLMVEGGPFALIKKRPNISDVEQLIETSKFSLSYFQNKLKLVPVPLALRLEIADYLSFTDFYFDGCISDYLVKQRIPEAQEQIADAIYRVSRLLKELKNLDDHNECIDSHS